MSLKEQQDLLARLYTDSRFARDLFADPRAGQGVSQDEVEGLAAAARSDVELFARSLISKRRREVAKILPQTCRYLASRLSLLFDDFAADFSPVSTKKHFEDAMAFADFLQGNSGISGPIKDAARYEKRLVEHHVNERWLTTGLFRHDVSLLRGTRSDDVPVLQPRLRFCLWLTLGKRTRFFCL